MTDRDYIVRQILAYIPDVKKEFIWDPIAEVYCLILIDKRAKISIPEKTSWESIKKHIDVKLSDAPKYCDICEAPITNTRITCTQCFKGWCIECHTKMIEQELKRSNQFKFICPYCRFEVLYK